MASSIEVVPIVASAVASDVPSEILPLKRVRKAILKPKSPSKMPKFSKKARKRPRQFQRRSLQFQKLFARESRKLSRRQLLEKQILQMMRTATIRLQTLLKICLLYTSPSQQQGQQPRQQLRRQRHQSGQPRWTKSLWSLFYMS